ncbi:hypothetical protein BDW59DRAFT_166262 [Aspergillus cavernicola]|uniref:Polyketide synthase n=1 Tax=Aspergillus cavernicola TaxID=176166 RepID=A0ABR4HMK7_9EURO
MSSPDLEPIAIVGLGCRFPGGADTPEKLWDLVYEGRQCWEEVPSSRFNCTAFYHPDPDARGTHNARGGFFLNQNLAAFDANFFGIPAAEAAAIDPQQRLLLEVSYEALENAGLPLLGLRGSPTGVYVALVSRDCDRQVYKDPDQIPKHHLTGCGDATACGRISYVFDLKGPCMSLDTGCSGSMVALHLACQGLRLGETNVALVGGTNLLFGPDMTIAMSALHMINENGKCYPFDSRGAGYGRAEGVAALVLKRLSDAIRDGDPIRAVIRNTGINQDGKTNGILLPSSEAQQDLSSSLYRQAGLDPRDVCYVEAHGTGTQAGDTAEVTSIRNVFASEPGTRERPLFLGSIKANLGHSESTSGLAGVIKTVMALEKGIIPPLAALETLKADLDTLLEFSDIIIPQKAYPWPHEGARLASVNSFGFGGTNAHVILESAPLLYSERDRVRIGRCEDISSDVSSDLTNGILTPSNDSEDDLLNADEHPQLFVVSARSKTSLDAVIRNVSHWVSSHATTYTKRQELAKTLSLRRSVLKWRSSIVASSYHVLKSALENPHLTKSSADPPVVFLFTGQGAQYHGMGRGLLGFHNSFSRCLQRSQDILTELGAPWGLVEELLREESTSRINTSELSQPATTAIQIALVDMLAQLNVQPTAALGHSSGEVAAAYAAGVLGHKEALTIAYYKGFVAGWCKEAVSSKGAMLAVGLGETQAMQYLEQSRSGRCVVACVNSPSSVTLSGDEVAVAEMQELFNRDSVFNRRLKVDIAYHSHHMQAVSTKFYQSLENVAAKQPHPSTRFFSSVTGLEKTSPLAASYWLDNLVSQVRFFPALQQLTQTHHAPSSESLAFVEIGPHSALQGPIRQIMNCGALRAKWSYTPSLIRNKDAHEAALEMIGTLFEHGAQVNLTTDLAEMRQVSTVITDLAPYPWDHSNQYWHESRLSKEYRFRHHPPHDLLGVRLNGTSTIEPIFRHILSIDELPWLREHIIDGFALYPGSAFLCMAIEALKQVSKDRREKREIAKYVFHEVSFSKALVVPESPSSIEVMTSLKPSRVSKDRMDMTWEEFRITSVAPDGTWNEHCKGSIRAEFQATLEDHCLRDPITSRARERLEEMSESCRESMAPENIYAQMRHNGIDYGHSFAIIQDLQLGDRQAIGKVQVPDIKPLMPSQHMQPHVIHPAVFDAFMHIVLPLYHRHCSQGPVMLTSVGDVSISADILNQPGDELLVACRLTQAGRRHGSVEVSIFQHDEQGGLIEVGSLSREDFRAIGEGGGLDKGVSHELPLPCYHLDWTPVPWFPSGGLSDSTACTQKINISCLLETTLELSLVTDLVSHLNVKYNSTKCSMGPCRVETMDPAAIHVIIIDGSCTSLPLGDLISVLCHLKSILLVTVSTEIPPGSPTTSANSLARVAQQEVEGLSIVTLDYEHGRLSDKHSLQEVVMEILWRSFLDTDNNDGPIDREYVYRKGNLLIPRLELNTSANQWLAASVNGSNIEETTGFHAVNRTLKLDFKRPGLLDSAVFVPVEDIPEILEPDELAVKVCAHAVNKGDIFIAMDRAQPTDSMLGEFAGVVVGVGSLCEDSYKLGDRVCGWGSIPYTNTARVKSHMVHRIDDCISFVEGASIPVAFQTAAHALNTIAGLEKSQRVLIHGAAGAVGQAAISIARYIGADIYATVGSLEKAQLLINQKGIAKSRIFSTRSTAFKDEILRLTERRGVDVVLNCSSGELLDESISCVADFGYLIDVTKSKTPVSSLTRNVTFVSIDMQLLAMKRPKQLEKVFTSVMALYQAGKLPPITPLIKTMSIAETSNAFRLVQSQHYSGKIVLTADDTVSVKQIAPKPQAPHLGASGAYAVVGGGVALNHALCTFLQERGAKHILSMMSSRAETEMELDMWDFSRFHRLEVDISRGDDVLSAISSSTCGMELRGILHVECIPETSPLREITGEEFQFSLDNMQRSKASMMHAAKHESVDFCITLASIGGLLGLKGRGIYTTSSPLAVPTAANSMTLRLGSIYGAERMTDLHHLLDYGISAVTRQASCGELFTGLDKDTCPRDNPIFKTICDTVGEAARDQSKSSTQKIDQQIASADSIADVHKIVMDAAVHQLSSFLAMDSDDIREESAVADLGLDSLLAIEFKNWVVRSTQAPMQTSEVLDAPSLSHLVQLIVRRSKLVQIDPSNTPKHAGKSKTIPHGVSATLTSQTDALPPLPIPELKALIDRHLSYLRAFATEQEFQTTFELAEDFQAPGGIGRRLYDRLQVIKDANPETWYHDLYLRNQYLVRNGPLAPYMNFFFTHPLLTSTTHSQAERAAIIASTVIRYKVRLDNGKIRPRRVNEQPLCMDLYKYLFNTTREPSLGVDVMRRYPGNEYFVVLRRGHVFKVGFNQQERLEGVFEAILETAVDDVDWLGILTAGDRISWAKTRQSFIDLSPENATYIHSIEKSAFVICLDDASPETPEQRGRHFHFADGSNRWHDKPIEFIITANGASGTLGDHTGLDAATVHDLNTEIAHNIRHYEKQPRAPPHNMTPPARDTITVETVQYSIPPSPPINCRIQEVRTAYTTAISSREHRYPAPLRYGSSFMKSHKIPANSAFQLIVQLAARYYFRHTTPCWETVLQSNFRTGRVEINQVVSTQIAAFVDAAADDMIALPKCRQLLIDAARTHSSSVLACTRAGGSDRFLSMLREIVEEGEKEPGLYHDPVYKRARPRKFISNCFPTGMAENGCCLRDDEGVWLHFEVEPEGLGEILDSGTGWGDGEVL